MNLFWRITVVVGLLVLAVQAATLLAILSRMPSPLVTFGQYKAAKTTLSRGQLHDQMPMAHVTAVIDDTTPIAVKVEEQPVEVRAVR